MTIYVTDKYYQKAIFDLLQAGIDFSKEVSIAEKFNFAKNDVGDLDIKEIFQAFAVLYAKLQKQLATHTDQLAVDLLTNLYPEVSNIIPATTIIQLRSKIAHVTIPNHTLCSVFNRDNKLCQFQTTQSITLTPIEILDTTCETFNSQIHLILKVTGLKKIETAFHDIYINSELTNALNLYSSIMSYDPTKDTPILYSSSYDTLNNSTPIGTVMHNTMHTYLYDKNPLHLLHEYKVFPEKFLFLRFKISKETISENDGFLLIPINHQNAILHKNLFLPNCVPIVNLFEKKSEPFKFDQTQQMYKVRPDMNEEAYEIYKIKKIFSYSHEQQRMVEWSNYFDITSDSDFFWKEITKPHSHYVGQTTFVSFIHNHKENNLPLQNKIISATCLCSNRQQATKINIDQSFAFKNEKNVTAKNILNIRPPIYTKQATMYWQLINNLGFNYLNLACEHNDVKYIRNFMRIYEQIDTTVKIPIDSLTDFTIKKKMTVINKNEWKGAIPLLEIALYFTTTEYILILAEILANIISKSVHFYSQVKCNIYINNKLVKIYTNNVF